MILSAKWQLFAYSTPKKVRFNDPRLALVSFIILAAVAIYILAYEIIIQKGYNQQETITGTTDIRYTLQVFHVDNPSYCGPSPTVGRDRLSFERLPCTALDEERAIKVVDSKTLFITTVVSSVTSVAQKDNSSCAVGMLVACSKVIDTISEAKYVFNPEGADILINHVTVPNPNRNSLKPVERSDKYSLGKVIGLAGLDLDGRSHVVPNATLRYSGGYLSFNIIYSGIDLTRQTYQVAVQPQSYPPVEHKQLIWSENSTHVSVTAYTMKGIVLKITQTGSFQRFSFLRLLLILCAGYCLWAIASTIVEFIYFWLLPKSKYYRLYKYLETEDMSLAVDDNGALCVPNGFGDTGPRRLEAGDFVYGRLYRKDDDKMFWEDQDANVNGYEQSGPHDETPNAITALPKSLGGSPKSPQGGLKTPSPHRVVPNIEDEQMNNAFIEQEEKPTNVLEDCQNGEHTVEKALEVPYDYEYVSYQNGEDQNAYESHQAYQNNDYYGNDDYQSGQTPYKGSNAGSVLPVLGSYLSHRESLKELINSSKEPQTFSHASQPSLYRNAYYSANSQALPPAYAAPAFVGAGSTVTPFNVSAPAFNVNFNPSPQFSGANPIPSYQNSGTPPTFAPFNY